MFPELKLTEKGMSAVTAVLETVAEVVALRPEGYPAGELYAAMMPWTDTLPKFETIMGLAVARGFVEKRGQLYFKVVK